MDYLFLHRDKRTFTSERQLYSNKVKSHLAI